MSSALVPYSAPPSTAVTTTSHSTSTSLLPSRFFTAQTGHALATELLYRLLYDILNRLLASLHRLASHQLDTFSSFLERKALERQQVRKDALDAAKNSLEKRDRGLRITEEVGRAATQSGFLGGAKGFACPVTGQDSGVGAPPGWVGVVLEGIEEGRLVERDFWGHPFVN